MNWTRRFVALVGAFAIMAGSGVSTLAQDTPDTTDTVTATLTAGVISFAIDVTSNFAPQSYTHSTGFTSGTGGAFTVFVKDDRNNAAGYTIGLSASHFVRNPAPGVIRLGTEEGTLAVTAATSVTRTEGDSLNLPTPSGVTSVTGVPATIVTAPKDTGNGHYTLSGYGLTFAVGGSTLVGTYESTLTVSSTAGPQQLP